MVQAFSGESPWRRSRIVQAVAQPAAGADWSIAVPAGHLWRLITVRAQLVTSAVVANRSVRLQLSDGVAPFARFPAQAVQAATGTVVYQWSALGPVYTLAPDSALFLPDLSLMAGWVLSTSTLLIDAGDQWSGIQLHLVDTTVQDGSIPLDTIPDVIVEVIAPSSGS